MQCHGCWQKTGTDMNQAYHFVDGNISRLLYYWGKQAKAQNEMLYHFCNFLICQKLFKKLKWPLKAFLSDTNCFE